MHRFITALCFCLATFVAIQLSGCLETDSLLPASRAAKSDQIVGQFYYEDDMKKRHDYVISASERNDLPYKAIVEGNKDEPLYFQLFDVEGTTLGFFRSLKSDKFTVAKLAVSKAKLEIDFVDPNFFKKNPTALPETTSKDLSVYSKATAQQLEEFFKKHHSSKELFSGKPAALTRSGS